MNALTLVTGCCMLAVLQSGCSTWPSHGAGGFAEHHLDTYIPVESNHALRAGHGLRFDFELLRRQLDILVMEGASYCFPASVVKSREMEQRIARELQGGLFHDAANDLLIQRAALARLERQLDAVHGVCQPPIDIAKAAQGDHRQAEHNRDALSLTLHKLLNSDNQFAVDSYQLNPKYVIRLAEAAAMLREHKQFSLRVIGHADFHGEADYNVDLSLQRAQQVARYLHVMGVEAERIHSEALGESSPLFDGTEAHVRLVNRRVTIEIIDQDTTVNPVSQLSGGQ